MQNKFIIFFHTVLFYVVVTTSSFSQDADKKSLIKSWDELCDQAEQSINTADTRNSVLDTFLDELLKQRKMISLEQVSNAEKISNLSFELEALGPKPDGNELEDESIAERRENLELRFEALNIPMLASSSILKRTDYLIDEIKSILRERLTRKLFSLGPSPLSLGLWRTSIDDLLNLSNQIRDEVSSRLKDKVHRSKILQKLPLTLFFIVIGFVLLIILYRRLFHKLLLIFEGKKSSNLKGWVFVCLTIIRFIILCVGAFSFIEAIKLLGLFGLYGTEIVNSLPVIALSFIITKWLAENLFSDLFLRQAPILLNTENEKVISNTLLFLATGFSMNFLMNNFNTKTLWSMETQTILNFPILIFSSFFLYRLSNFIKQPINNSVSSTTNSLSLVDLLGKLSKLVAIITPIIAVSGYLFAAKSLIYPYLQSLLLFGVSFIIYVLIKELFSNLLTDKEGDTSFSDNGWALLPVIIAFVLTLGLVPLLALIWGAQSSDLYEIWLKLNEGVPLGKARLTLPGLLSFVVIFSLGYGATKIIQRILRTNVLPKTRLDPGGKNALISGVGYSGIILSTMIAISSTGLDLSSLAIVAGALSVGLGFGLQTIVSNFVSGVILLIERPIKEGDWIEVAGFSGTVRKISVRSTQIQTFDRGTVIVPNSELIAGSVLNYTHSNSMGRVRVPVGVAYGTDPRKVETILLGIANNHPQVLQDPSPSVVFMGFGADSIDFEIRAFMKDVGYVLAIKSEMNYEITEAFKKEGIEIPFAQRDINIKNFESLKAAFDHNAKNKLKGA